MRGERKRTRAGRLGVCAGRLGLRAGRPGSGAGRLDKGGDRGGGRGGGGHPARCTDGRRPSREGDRDRDRGSSALEFAGMLPLLLLVAVAAIQLGIAGYAVQQAGTGARAAARVASQEDIAGEYAASGRAAMSNWTAARSSFALGGGGEEVEVTTTVTIPSLVPGIDSFGEASRSATMPRD
ncbi:TadE/TadG family type IV pilus assembly protein [Streptomyces iconiensis]|uniref:TadE/TadG family type IV pilus assembly protein n=1 Tax=Streptomyces iconiensis TaxID=1384038 RepID=UPI00235E8E8A